MKIIKEFWPILVLIISCFTISIAWIAEYFFDILPCQMCLYQRYRSLNIRQLFFVFEGTEEHEATKTNANI